MKLAVYQICNSRKRQSRSVFGAVDSFEIGSQANQTNLGGLTISALQLRDQQQASSFIVDVQVLSGYQILGYILASTPISWPATSILFSGTKSGIPRLWTSSPSMLSSTTPLWLQQSSHLERSRPGSTNPAPILRRTRPTTDRVIRSSSFLQRPVL
jgi:hypothetical protein